jgi:uncharacterized membrane protein
MANSATDERTDLPPAVPPQPYQFSAAEVGAPAHLYRGEVYRSTIWRTRLDNTTNWAVVTTGIALSATYASADASPLPLVLVGLLVVVFLMFEARRYRFFNVRRARARLLETDFFAPMLLGEGIQLGSGWTQLLANDYRQPRYHISYALAIGRRLRRNYAPILAIQALAYYAKLAIHPKPMGSFTDLWERAAIGPISGRLVVLAGIVFHGSWVVFLLYTLGVERQRQSQRKSPIAMG